ncbi:glycoside hydrolase family 43 protein [Actinoallomurus spadix]|uniref:Glycoside hydrolase family 43 protein n=1 Tax=Actinoallomurus spadix TaxID=79912 RepID=A0ABN0WJH2_9ACTN|nr:glycoside hydrolase family 43 protein [Actinoallomurus spadix]MCO5990547.1 glycoside hydrolase family 43 protein [Actinoallomurus spadix]
MADALPTTPPDAAAAPGRRTIHSAPAPRTFRNPILPGFYPDPSICRVGDDYYLVSSTFEWFPGLPVHHSRDLVNWRLLGHVLDRPEQLPLDGVQPSGGLYAPTIRHADGVFYVVCTLMYGTGPSGNFVVTATDPAGPWSEPHWLGEPDSFDPSLLFDEDGRVWFHATRPVDEDGHTEVWLREFDPATLSLTGPEHVLWHGALDGAVWAEGPHLYRVGDSYHLMVAEGGTELDHAVTVARSRQITGPYEGNPRNPILTHRNLGTAHPIVATGHADLVETAAGEWWAVMLAIRPSGGYLGNLGRETFLAPVTWEEGWPVIAPGAGRVEATGPRPDLPECRWPAEPACDNFEDPELGPEWIQLRTPRERFWNLTERPGHLRLRLRPETVTEHVCPSLIARRQRHAHFAAQTALDFVPAGPNECAGLVLLQNDDFQIRCVVTLGDGGRVLRLVRRAAGADETLAEEPLPEGRVRLAVEAHDQAYAFRYAMPGSPWRPLGGPVDGSVLSTEVAGGFIGACLGMYASSTGADSANVADFDWFEYRGLE